jgi:hypothetical protein
MMHGPIRKHTTFKVNLFSSNKTSKQLNLIVFVMGALQSLNQLLLPFMLLRPF